MNGKGLAAQGAVLAWNKQNKLYPEERGESLAVVADGKVVRLRSYHFHDVFVKLSLLSLKDSKKTHFGCAEYLSIAPLDAARGLCRLWRLQAGGGARRWERQPSPTCASGRAAPRSSGRVSAPPPALSTGLGPQNPNPAPSWGVHARSKTKRGPHRCLF